MYTSSLLIRVTNQRAVRLGGSYPVILRPFVRQHYTCIAHVLHRSDFLSPVTVGTTGMLVRHGGTVFLYQYTRL